MRISDCISAVCSSDLEWPALMAANPFPEETQREPNRVLALLSKSPPPADAADRLMERAQAGARVKASGSALWFHVPDGAGASKLTSTFIDKVCGSPGTTRNLSTLDKLAAMGGVARSEERRVGKERVRQGR